METKTACVMNNNTSSSELQHLFVMLASKTLCYLPLQPIIDRARRATHNDHTIIPDQASRWKPIEILDQSSTSPLVDYDYIPGIPAIIRNDQWLYADGGGISYKPSNDTWSTTSDTVEIPYGCYHLSSVYVPSSQKWYMFVFDGGKDQGPGQRQAGKRKKQLSLYIWRFDTKKLVRRINVPEAIRSCKHLTALLWHQHHLLVHVRQQFYHLDSNTDKWTLLPWRLPSSLDIIAFPELCIVDNHMLMIVGSFAETNQLIDNRCWWRDVSSLPTLTSDRKDSEHRNDDNNDYEGDEEGDESDNEERKKKIASEDAFWYPLPSLPNQVKDNVPLPSPQSEKETAMMGPHAELRSRILAVIDI
jgi:hypothetical protein